MNYSDNRYEDDNDDEVEYYAIRPNKTALKKEIGEMFDLAETLTKLPQDKLAEFDLPEKIENALTQAAHMPHNGARKRLLKYVAGQFHKLDVSAIQEHLAIFMSTSKHAAREHHLIENWREKLLQEGNSALTELMNEAPDTDAQHIRQLIKHVKKEESGGQPPKSSRLLYRYLKTLLQAKFENDVSKPLATDD
jgi:ribosome-associated protein